MGFFESQQAAAVFKHGILKRYLTVFASKTGSTSKDGRVVFLDGYAGRGVYEDGSLGSPAIAAEAAVTLARRKLVGIYIEKDRQSCDHLRSMLDKRTHHESHVFHGEVADHLDEALKIAADSPLLVFIDPFGLPSVSPTTIKKIFDRSRMVGPYRTGPATEILVNFIYQGYLRPAGWLKTQPSTPRDAKTRETMLATLDDRLGGDWWREIEEEGGEDRVRKIAAGYRDRLLETTGIIGWFWFPVSRRWEGPPVYDLMILTQYPDAAFWVFNENVSLALKDFYEHCTKLEEGAQQTLPLEPVSARAAKWVDEIKKNLGDALAAAKTLVPSSDLKQVFGAAVGHAREKHLRAAIKALYKEGKTSCEGKGSLAKIRISPSSK